MREVLPLAKSIDDQYFQFFQFLDLLLRNCLCISYICEITYSVAEDRQLTVHHTDWDNLQPIDIERCVIINLMHVECRYTGVGVRTETIVEAFVKVVVHILLKIDRHIAVGAEGAQVIDTPYMIIVAVGKEDGIDVSEILAKSLFAEIGRGIDEESHAVGTDKHRGAQPFVSRIFRSTDPASAGHFRNTFRSATTEDGGRDACVDNINLRVKHNGKVSHDFIDNHIGKADHIVGRCIAGVCDDKTIGRVDFSSSDSFPFESGMFNEPSGWNFHPMLSGGVEWYAGVQGLHLLLEIVAADNRILEKASGTTRHFRIR